MSTGYTSSPEPCPGQVPSEPVVDDEHDVRPRQQEEAMRLLRLAYRFRGAGASIQVRDARGRMTASQHIAPYRRRGQGGAHQIRLSARAALAQARLGLEEGVPLSIN